MVNPISGKIIILCELGFLFFLFFFLKKTKIAITHNIDNIDPSDVGLNYSTSIKRNACIH